MIVRGRLTEVCVKFIVYFSFSTGNILVPSEIRLIPPIITVSLSLTPLLISILSSVTIPV